MPGVERVRLSSVEVIHVKDSLLDALAGEPKVCPHLHVPLQSGDDGVLAAMGRHYTAAEYLQRVAGAARAVPQVNVTTDVIVGFPTEDEAAFERPSTRSTRRASAACTPSRTRPGPGRRPRLGDPVPAEEKKRRSKALRGPLRAPLAPPSGRQARRR